MSPGPPVSTTSAVHPVSGGCAGSAPVGRPGMTPGPGGALPDAAPPDTCSPEASGEATTDDGVAGVPAAASPARLVGDPRPDDPIAVPPTDAAHPATDPSAITATISTHTWARDRTLPLLTMGGTVIVPTPKADELSTLAATRMSCPQLPRRACRNGCGRVAAWYRPRRPRGSEIRRPSNRTIRTPTTISAARRKPGASPVTNMFPAPKPLFPTGIDRVIAGKMSCFNRFS